MINFKFAAYVYKAGFLVNIALICVFISEEKTWDPEETSLKHLHLQTQSRLSAENHPAAGIVIGHVAELRYEVISNVVLDINATDDLV